MNKKIFIIIAMLIANQSFATTDITGNSASCDSGVLGVETGGVALKADYSPETIELRWYDDTGKQIALTSEYASCTYNDSINIPTAPAKTGYKFAGWKVRPKYDFSTLDTSIDGTLRIARSKNQQNDSDICWHHRVVVTCSAEHADLNRYQWKTVFSYGTIYGEALCSNTTDGKSFAQTGNPGDVTGQYCWCKTTGYRPNNSDITYSPSSTLPWVLDEDYNTVSNCQYICPLSCASVENYSNMRRAQFGVTP